MLGSWLYDTHTIRYISDKYGLDALCNCKEQYGTDGYTLWGGYYGQGYYPNRNNVFIPAQTCESQIPVPVFRMLGSDPVYQYDYGLNVDCEEQEAQKVITLEPLCLEPGGGGVPKWVDWYIKENFNGECLSFGYAQAGQENSFSWETMKGGLDYQFALFEQLQKQGKIIVERLGDTGRWYKEAYTTTPASTITAHTTYDNKDINTVWYSSKYFRINLHSDHGTFRIRDLHIFSEKYLDPFEDEVSTENEATYETLPVIDGTRHSGNGVLAGGYLVYEDGDLPDFNEMKFTDAGKGTAIITYGSLRVELAEDRIKIIGASPFILKNKIGTIRDHLPTVKRYNEEEIILSYQNVDYGIWVLQGKILEPTCLQSDGNVLEVQLNKVDFAV